MSNAFTENATGGISFSMPLTAFGTTTPAMNSGYSFDLPMTTIAAFQNQALTFTSNNSARNTGFLDTVIGRSQAQVSTTADNVLAYQGRALDLFTQINESQERTARYAIERKRQKSGCFITTAICKQDGLPDDCNELQVLRDFRDNFMLKDEKLRRLVKVYYEVAPLIVESIDKRTDAKAVYWFLREMYLRPAIRAIKSGDAVKAVEIYRNMVAASSLYLEGWED